MDIGSCRPRANKWFQSIVCRDRHWELRPNERKTWCCWESVSNDETTAAAPISDHETKGKIQAIFRSPRRHTDRRDKSCIRWHYQWRQPQPSILVLSCLGLWLFRFVPGAEGLDLWKAARYYGERMRWQKGRNRAVWEVG